MVYAASIITHSLIMVPCSSYGHVITSSKTQNYISVVIEAYILDSEKAAEFRSVPFEPGLSCLAPGSDCQLPALGQRGGFSFGFWAGWWTDSLRPLEKELF